MPNRALTAATAVHRESTPISGRAKLWGRSMYADSFDVSPVRPVRAPRVYLESGDEEGSLWMSPALANVAASTEPTCRICHGGDRALPLVSICLCPGTTGLVHQLCLERWLCASGSEVCEVCHYRFNVERRPRRFREWLLGANVRRGFLVDLVFSVLLPPVAISGGLLCVRAVARQMLQQQLSESIGLAPLSPLLFTAYSAWLLIACRSHQRRWKEWRDNNPYVKVVDAPRQFQNLPENEIKEATVLHVGAPPLPAATSDLLPNTWSDSDSSSGFCTPTNSSSGSRTWESDTLREEGKG